MRGELDCSRPADNPNVHACEKLALPVALKRRVGRSIGPVRASDYQGCIPAVDFQEFACLELDRDAELCEGETSSYNVSVLLRRSEVRLDCHGATLEHTLGATHHLPIIGATYDHSLHNVSIRRCKVRGSAAEGIDLKRRFRGAELLNTPLEGHRDVRIEDSEVSGAAESGIYVGQASQDTKIIRTKISDSHSVGIYVEASSRGTLISEVEIAGSRDKEGVALDSSTQALVEKSVFHDNPHGSIFLYHNCGELHGQVCPILRPEGASANTLRENHFSDPVVIAARQLKGYPRRECAENGGHRGKIEDRADGNHVERNIFRDTYLAVQAGENSVVDNRFERSTLFLRGYSEGKEIQLSDVPVSGNTFIASNIVLQVDTGHASERTDPRKQAEFVPRLVDVELTDNRAAGGRCYSLANDPSQAVLLDAGVPDNICRDGLEVMNR